MYQQVRLVSLVSLNSLMSVGEDQCSCGGRYKWNNEEHIMQCERCGGYR